MYDKVQSKIEDSGVSPVIGVILMVAVTVALVALVTVIVFDIGGDVSESPDATVNLENDSGAIKATVLRNENVESFSVQADTESNGQQTYSLGSDAGASITESGTSTSQVTGESNQQDDGSGDITNGETITVSTTGSDSGVVSIDNVQYDPSGNGDGTQDVTSDFSITDASAGELTYGGSTLTNPSSGDDFVVDYSYDDGGSLTFTNVRVIATMSDGSEQVLTSTDF